MVWTEHCIFWDWGHEIIHIQIGMGTDSLARLIHDIRYHTDQANQYNQNLNYTAGLRSLTSPT